MIPLIKDYATQKKSFTITLLTLGVMTNLAAIAIGLIKMLENSLSPSDIAFAFYVFSFLGLGASLYYKKRARLGASGIEFSSELDEAVDEVKETVEIEGAEIKEAVSEVKDAVRDS